MTFISKNKLGWFLVTALVMALYVAIFFIGKNKIEVLSYTQNPTGRFSMLAQAFSAGQTNFIKIPSAEFLKLADPYDPDLNMKIDAKDRTHDMSYYKGRYFLYYGPTTSLVILLLHFFKAPYFSDNAFVLIWSLAFALVWALFFNFFANTQNMHLLFGLSNSKSNQLSQNIWRGGYLFSALNIGILACLVRAGFYEVAITSAAFFFWAGIVTILYAIVSFISKRLVFTSILCFLSGVLLSLAFLSRYSYAPTICFIVLLVLGTLYFHTRNSSSAISTKAFLTCAAIFLVPFFIMSIGFFAYNYARFGSITDTGFSYVLSGFPQHKLAVTKGLFTVDHILANVWSYFFKPFDFIDVFPFVAFADIAIPAWTKYPSEYFTGGMIGVFSYFLFIYVVIAVAFIAILKNKSTKKLSMSSLTIERKHCWVILGMIFLILAIIQMLPLLLLFSSETRYITDFILCLMASCIFFFVGALTYLQTNSSAQLRNGILYLSYVTMMITAVMAVMLMFELNSIVKSKNPKLFAILEKTPKVITSAFYWQRPITPVAVIASSEQNKTNVATNLLNSERGKYWAVNSNQESKIEFSFDNNYDVKRVVIHSPHRDSYVNEFWHYYEFMGYRNGQLIFDKMRAAQNPLTQNIQTFHVSGGRIDKLVIIGYSPVLQARQGQIILKPSEVHPGFSKVEFFAKL